MALFQRRRNNCVHESSVENNLFLQRCGFVIIPLILCYLHRLCLVLPRIPYGFDNVLEGIQRSLDSVHARLSITWRPDGLDRVVLNGSNRISGSRGWQRRRLFRLLDLEVRCVGTVAIGSPSIGRFPSVGFLDRLRDLCRLRLSRLFRCGLLLLRLNCLGRLRYWNRTCSWFVRNESRSSSVNQSTCLVSV